jgi:uncharacterized membrane protein YhfC
MQTLRAAATPLRVVFHFIATALALLTLQLGVLRWFSTRQAPATPLLA